MEKTKIWIQEEKATAEFLENIPGYIKINGNIKHVYYIGAHMDGNNDNVDQLFLQRFLLAQYKYPIYLTFVVFDNEEEDMMALLEKHHIPYSMIHLEEMGTYYTLFKKHRYHPPCFTIQIMDATVLEFILEETYWRAEANEFFCFSYGNNLQFELNTVTEWGRKKERSFAIFNGDTFTTYITIEHDGRGFYLFSNEEKYKSIESLCENFPEGCVITQINDQLIEE